MIPTSPQRAQVRGQPVSFFANANLYTIEEGSSHSKSMASSDLNVENGSSRHGSLTALPKWDPPPTPRRTPLSHIQNPKRAFTRPHTRQSSEEAMLEKNTRAQDAERGRNDNDSSGASTPVKKARFRKSRMMFWLILVAVSIILLAIILGAVLGTFLNPKRNTPQPAVTEIPSSNTPTPTSNPNGQTPIPTTSMRLKSLATTGWSVPGSQGYFVVWLFSQNKDGYLDRHTFNSSTGNWIRVTNFAKAKPGTPLTAFSLDAKSTADQLNYNLGSTQYQTSVVYLDDKNYLSEWIFPDNGPAVGTPGTLNKQKYIAIDGTGLASYWPKVMYQGLSGEIREAYFQCGRNDVCWQDIVLDTSEARNGTRLVAVPMANELSVTGLFYQEPDGRVVNYEENTNVSSAVWTNNAFANLIPSNSSVAAFSTVRTGLPNESKLNTYLMWQDKNNTIQVSWTENDKGWRGPITHEALRGANNNTALTCLTGIIPIAAGTELARCYFQAGSSVRQVSFDGSSWSVVGTVPVNF
ncbi:hypothetical protein B0J11DRAFT_222954 [Dendryphion nanum]|uniref:Fucose-specific lectin n=1 Tax=Dendryphion nanum TaxID=256645 RepID=A0A9P9E7G0_9PLEO|nr:hypothetical protein B0J11DRAFT_222954 [Dendryphion nanum]